MQSVALKPIIPLAFAIVLIAATYPAPARKECGAQPPCYDALSRVDGAAWSDPWQRFRSRMGEPFQSTNNVELDPTTVGQPTKVSDTRASAPAGTDASAERFMLLLMMLRSDPRAR